ncbi:MAG: Hsp20/alpha crystallin family protein [Planctomycetes bacterium]|nr:Hsp20/alpha crystallin family protein [Planctomycetota bacterium]
MNAIETRNGNARRVTPACDVWETKDGVHVVAEMPGVEAGAVEVTVERDLLSIRGRAELPRPSARAQGLTATVPVEYLRQFQLADTADADAIQASAKDGLVRVLVPRKVPAQRRIPVAVG